MVTQVKKAKIHIDKLKALKALEYDNELISKKLDINLGVVNAILNHSECHEKSFEKFINWENGKFINNKETAQQIWQKIFT